MKKENDPIIRQIDSALPEESTQLGRQSLKWLLGLGAAAVLILVFAVCFGLGSYAAQAKKEGNAKPGPGATPPLGAEASSPPAPPNTGQSADDWRLVLVNPWHSLPEDYEFTLTHLRNEQAVDKRCYPDLQDMMDACRAAGLSPLICSSYRTWEKQEQLFNEKLFSLKAEGYSEADALAEAGKTVSVPGTSEHQLGLAIDIVDVDNQNLDSTQENTAVQQWLMRNSWQYGFILRYPAGKSELTGIIYEPWHYRYVGKAAAAYIYENGLCLEEYLEQLS
jgi:D-alanyl-D-alanine carboxypeptidase